MKKRNKFLLVVLIVLAIVSIVFFRPRFILGDKESESYLKKLQESVEFHEPYIKNYDSVIIDDGRVCVVIEEYSGNIPRSTDLYIKTICGDNVDIYMIMYD